MDEGQNYRRLGLFVLVTLALLAGILFVLGGRSLFQPTFTFETYFNESVAGLEIGAPVQFRGVPLGQVTEILTARSSLPARRAARQAQEVHCRPSQGLRHQRGADRADARRTLVRMWS